MQLTYLHIRNFKSIRDLEIRGIDRALILVGKNNTEDRFSAGYFGGNDLQKRRKYCTQRKYRNQFRGFGGFCSQRI